MKKYISIIILVIATLLPQAVAQDSLTAQESIISPQPTSSTGSNESLSPREKWDQANIYYQNEEYTSAILIYEDLLGSNEHSEKLYYNLGNAYFKNNNLGKAILNYNRALLLNPGDEDIQHNMAIATARTVDKIEPVPQFFLKKWFVELGEIFTSNGWTIFALIFLVITLCGVIIWLIAPSLKMRKLGFYTAFIAVIITITSFVYAQSNFIKQTNSNDAIIMNTAAPVKSSPSNSGKDLFLLHEGTKVTILDEVEGWNEIRLEDGNKGWIQKNTIEKIIL